MENEGKAKGGYARAAKLSGEERKAIAQKAAKERWEGTNIPKETHPGVVKIGDIKIPCAVLDNGVRVLRERSVAKAFGKRGSGAHWKRKRSGQEGAYLPEYVSAKNLESLIDEEIKKKLLNPISYITKSGAKAWGLPATLLPEICDIWLKAREIIDQIKKEVSLGNIKPIQPQHLILNMMSMCVFPFVFKPISRPHCRCGGLGI